MEAQVAEECGGRKVDGGSESHGRDAGLTVEAIKIHSEF